MAELRERFLGSILGCAVGDALGAPFEGSLPESILLDSKKDVQFRRIPGYPLGQYTDDTQLTMAIMRAICRSGGVDGATIAEEFVELWETGEIVGAGASCSDAVYNMVRRGMSWEKAGTPQGRAGNGTAMRAAPVGLWNYAHPDRIENEAKISSIITHKDTRSVGGTIAVASAVELCVNSTELEPPDFLRNISGSVRGTSELFAECLDDLGSWLRLEPSEALPRIYASGRPDMGPRQPPFVTAYVIPTVLCALYFFLRTPRNLIESLIGAINAGGDTDTVAAITGSISGAFNGISSIPQGLVETLKDSKKIISLAERFYEASVSRG
jgi:ADP-ribosyl-[dinitrogen reductase] hydrolase